jgi:hypothetical protein
VLNAYVFESLDQVLEISEDWLRSYNEERSRDALAGMPPATYRAQIEVGNSPWLCLVDKGVYKASSELMESIADKLCQ